MDKITLQATGDFPFVFYIEKAIPKEENGLLIVEGVASTVNVDHDNERMAESALHSMANIINEKSVPLRWEHNKDDNAVIGDVYSARVDERNQLWIKAAINPNHPSGPMLHESLKQGAKFGLSVGGRIKNAVRELVESTGNMVNTFYDVVLEEVSVTRKPANYDAWLVQKSLKSKDQDTVPFYKSSLYKQFLFENPMLDYAQQFAKSIPDKEWSKVNNNNKINNNMEKKLIVKSEEDIKDEDKKEKGEEKKDDKETEKSIFVTKSELAEVVKAMTEGFAGITKFLSKMESTPKDTNNPDKDKEKNPGDGVDKAREGQDDKGGNGTENAEGKKVDAGNAHDQDAPNKDKEENPGDGKKSQKAEGKDDEKETEKAEDKKDEKETEKAEDKKDEKETEKAEDKDEDKEKSEGEDDDKEAMKTLSAALKSISDLSKSEGEIKKSATPEIDRFAVVMGLAVDSLMEKFEKSGKRVPGLGRMFADMVMNDKGIQAEIASMMKQPGFKKSVSLGIPYMVTKDGKKFQLSATPVGEDKSLKKSREGKSFQDVFKSEFSSFNQEQSQ